MAYPFFPVSQTSSTLTQIAIQALAGQGEYGVVSEIAREYDVSRAKVYELREDARAALEDTFDDTVPTAFQLNLTPQDIIRSIIALRVVGPNSVRDIVALLPILFGEQWSWSYGTVWQILHEAEIQAEKFLAQVNLSGIFNVALDEMFSQGKPVFGGIDLDSQYLFQLQKHPSRTGADWADSLKKLCKKQHLNPKRVVKDAGTGLAKGVTEAWPMAEQRDDLFHAVLLMGKESYHLERRAYGAINTLYEKQAKRACAPEGKRHKLGQEVRRARERAEAAIERYDRFEALRREATLVLELSDPGSGRLHSGEEVVATLNRVSEEMKSLGGKRIAKVARYLKNRAPGLARYLDDLGRRLEEVTEAAGGAEVVEAVTRAYQASLNAHRRCSAWERKARKQELSDATSHLLAITGGEPDRMMRGLKTVLPILQQKYRASSAIENLNSVLRPYLVVHKDVSQGFLHLFQFYWNTRIREWGRGKNTSAYEQLTGEQVDDWLTLLGYPPSQKFAAAA